MAEIGRALGDRFVFHPGYDKDTITGLAHHGAGGSDLIDINGFGLNFTTRQAARSPFEASAAGV